MIGQGSMAGFGQVFELFPVLFDDFFIQQVIAGAIQTVNSQCEIHGSARDRTANQFFELAFQFRIESG